MTDPNAAKACSREEMAKGILEGWCVRHDLALVAAEEGWVRCPRSGGTARAFTDGRGIVVEMDALNGFFTVVLPTPNEVKND